MWVWGADIGLVWSTPTPPVIRGGDWPLFSWWPQSKLLLMYPSETKPSTRGQCSFRGSNLVKVICRKLWPNIMIRCCTINLTTCTLEVGQLSIICLYVFLLMNDESIVPGDLVELSARLFAFVAIFINKLPDMREINHAVKMRQRDMASCRLGIF